MYSSHSTLVSTSSPLTGKFFVVDYYSELISFIKEAAEYYLLFSGTILFLGAGTFSGTLMPFATRLGHRILDRVMKQPTLRKFIGTHLLNVNSIWRTDFSQEPELSQPKESLLSHVPLPVGASLKWTITTGHVALFSAFIAFGNWAPFRVSALEAHRADS